MTGKSFWAFGFAHFQNEYFYYNIIIKNYAKLTAIFELWDGQIWPTISYEQVATQQKK